MNFRRWILAAISAFAVIFVLDFLVHAKLLMGLYHETMSIWRPQAESMKLMPLMTFGQFIFALTLAWFYTKGYEPGKSGAVQGLRYGFYVGLLIVASQHFIWYVVLPIPPVLALAWHVSAFINCLVAGWVIGVVYSPINPRT